MTPPSSSFRLDSKSGMQLHNLRHQLQQDPHLSPTHIRNLVKQLATSGSRSKHSMNPDLSPAPNSTRQGRVLDASHHAPKSTHRQPHKRQIRRRLHTARPYQDSLLNMAEARKEIVTALKFHRASMKRQEARQQQQPTVPLLPLQDPCFQQDGGIMSLRNHPGIYPSRTDNFSNHVADSSFHPSLSVPNPLNWPPASSPVAPPQMAENVGYKLPNGTLGLKLNFQNFDNLDAALHLDNNSASFYPYSYPSSSSSLSTPTDQEVPSVAISQGEGSSALADGIDSIAATQVAGGQHTGMADEGTAEIRSSTLWPKLEKNMEHQATEDDAAHPVFDGPMEFPDWLNANERCFEQCSEEYALDPTLPCMDIGDFEGIGEEWLA